MQQTDLFATLFAAAAPVPARVVEALDAAEPAPAIVAAAAPPADSVVVDGLYRTRIEAWQLPELEARYAKLIRKAARLGLVAPTLEVGAPYERQVPVRDRRPGAYGRVLYVETRTYVDVAAETRPMRLDGWTFAVALDHGPAGNIIRELPGAYEGDVERWRHAPNDCGHCGTARGRHSTYVVRHEADGRVIQVGSTCLADFLRGGSAAHAAMLVEYGTWLGGFAGGEDSDRDPDAPRGGGRRPWGLGELLTLTSALMRAEGWRSRGKAREDGGCSTSDRVPALAMALARGELDERAGWTPEHEPTEADATRAAAGLAWARSLPIDGRSSYLNNLSVLAAQGYATDKQLGLACSILAAKARADAKDQERAARPERANEHLGRVGAYHVALAKLVRVVELSGDFGATYLGLFEAQDGASLKWYSSRPLPEAGWCGWVAGAVKRHGEYKGRKETVLSRATLDLDGNLDPDVHAPKLEGLTAAQGRRLHALALGLPVTGGNALTAKLEALGLVTDVRSRQGTVTEAGWELLTVAGVTRR